MAFLMRKRLVFVLMLLCIALFVSCNNELTPTQDHIDYDSRDLNVILMDLYLTNEVFPSFDYYYRVKRDLRSIELLYGETYPCIHEIDFRFPYNHNEFRVVVDDDTKLLIDAGEYPAWDSLNAYFNLDTLIDYGDYYLLRFNCCCSMAILDRDYYNKLPGIVNTDPNGLLHYYPITNLFPRVFGDTLSYLYSYCDGPDLCGGCYFVEYHYFRSVERKIEFVGTWNSISGEPCPDWWYDEAYLNDWEYYEIYYE